MRAEFEGFRLEDEERDEEASVSKGQAGEPMADERATEKVALQSLVAAEGIEDDSSCVANYRGGLDAILAIGQ